jgi:hypothetical protein
MDAGETLYINLWNMWGAEGYKDADGNEAPEWALITDETVYNNEAGDDPVSGKFLWDT